MGLHGLLPEVMRADQVDQKRHDALIFGPGIQSYLDFEHLWTSFPNPIVVDAGGLHLLSELKTKKSSFPRIITPHSAEAARLLGCKKQEVEHDPFEKIYKLRAFSTAILKGPYSKILGDSLLIAPKGSSRLATAGSGDILSGFIGALCAKQIPLQEACAIGCFLHAKAGESMQFGDSASDILNHTHRYIHSHIVL